MSIFRAFFFQHRLSRYRWYRQWHGGRWERHFIDVCMCFIWLPMQRPRVWPEYRQPCSIGAPTIEDYPDAPPFLGWRQMLQVWRGLKKEPSK